MVHGSSQRTVHEVVAGRIDATDLTNLSNLRDAANACADLLKTESEPVPSTDNHVTRPKYTGVITELVVGEGTNTLMCGSDSYYYEGGYYTEFHWLKYNNAYSAGSVELEGNFYYILSADNAMIFAKGLGYFSTVYVCRVGQNQCTKYDLTIYDAVADTNNYEVKSKNNVMAAESRDNSNPTRGGAGGYLFGGLYNLEAVYFDSSSLYKVNLLNGNVRVYNIPFVSKPTGGNISLDLTRVVSYSLKNQNPCSNVPGLGPFGDTIEYRDDNNVSFSISSLPPGATCITRILNVRNP